MLPFFPSPYTDEILFSTLGRFHDWNYTPIFRRTLSELIGESGACATVGFPSHLGRLMEVLPLGTTLTAEQIIKKHTLFSLFSPFLPKDRTDTIMRYMVGEQGGVLYQTVGAMASGITMLRYLRYCRQCMQEDAEEFGEAYWHRVHQIPGISVCPIHLCGLSDSEICISPPQNKTVFYPVPSEVTHNNADPEVFGFPYADVAQAALWLLTNDTPIWGLDSIRQRYISLLQKKDLATFRGRIRQREVADAFVGFYSTQFLEEVYSMINSSANETWLSRLLQKPRTVCHPLRHILLILFLETTPEEFFTGEIGRPYPFGNAPWPCLNPACGHYRKDVIRTCLVSRDTETGCPVGTFACECGFIYSRRGPDCGADARYKIGRIKAFGERWHQKLWEYINIEKYSLREAARRLMVDPGTVKSQLAVFLGEKAIHTRTPKGDQGNQLNSYRAKLLLLIRIYPDKCRTEIRAMKPGVYAWLYRHDRDWLFANLPTTMRRRCVPDSRVDWSDRDCEICSEIVDAAKALKNKEPLVRVSISSLGKYTGHLSLLHKHLDKLPRTREVLKLVLENIEEFQERRILYVIRQMKLNGVRPVTWKIMRDAGLKKGAEERVQRIIACIFQDVEKTGFHEFIHEAFKENN